MRRALRGIGVLGIVVATVAGFYVRGQLAPVREEAEAQVFTVERGSGLARVAQRLEAAGLIRNAWLFVALGRWQELASSLRAGEYDVSSAWTPSQILEQLTSGTPKTYPIVIPEGLRMSEIAARLEQAGLADAKAFLDVARDPELAHRLGIEGEHLEGYLFPETYRLQRGLPPEEVARIMVGQFDRVWSEVAEAAEATGLTRHELVTLASIVEKETGATDERPLIAAVFWNRLRRGMRLETDPTVIYGIPDFDGNLRRVHLLDESNAYNTYRIRGLPPGPIANPGRAALRAVVEPAASDYLYFVARGNGTHVFSRSYAEHDRAVDRFQRKGSRR